MSKLLKERGEGIRKTIALHERNQEIMDLLVRGYDYAEIARRTGLASKNAVHNHVVLALRDLQQQTRASSELYRARMMGLLETQLPALLEDVAIQPQHVVDAAGNPTARYTITPNQAAKHRNESRKVLIQFIRQISLLMGLNLGTSDQDNAREARKVLVSVVNNVSMDAL